MVLASLEKKASEILHVSLNTDLYPFRVLNSSYLSYTPVSLKHGVAFPETADDMTTFNAERSWAAMEGTVDAGLARHIGVSNFSIEKLKTILKSARIKPEVNQVERHPYLQQKDLAQFCKDNDIHITNYSSLGSGDRPAAFKPEGEPVLMEDAVIRSIASEIGSSAAGVLLKWGILEGASVIPKSVNAKRLQENLDVDSSVALGEDEMKTIRAMDRKRRYVDGTFWCVPKSPYTLESLWDEEIPSKDKSEL